MTAQLALWIPLLPLLVIGGVATVVTWTSQRGDGS